LKVLGIVLIVLGAVLYASLGGPDDNPIALIGIPFLLGGVLLYFRGRQHATRANAERPNSPLRDSKPDILYLRSFQTDPSTMSRQLMSGLTTEEEELASVLRPFGDMVAIGQPGERLPVPGATKMYADQSEWKAVVLDRMSTAPLVVIRAGNTPGLLWEMGQAVQTLEPKRLLILVLNIQVHDYNTFANQVRLNLGLNLPQIESSSLIRTVIDRRESPSKAKPGFVAFWDDWTATFLPLPETIIRTGYNDLTRPFSIALRPVFARHGIAWHEVGRLGR
jgi:hypothetical protein